MNPRLLLVETSFVTRMVLACRPFLACCSSVASAERKEQGDL